MGPFHSESVISPRFVCPCLPASGANGIVRKPVQLAALRESCIACLQSSSSFAALTLPRSRSNDSVTSSHSSNSSPTASLSSSPGGYADSTIGTSDNAHASGTSVSVEVLVIDSDAAACEAVRAALDALGYACECHSRYETGVASAMRPRAVPFQLGTLCLRLSEIEGKRFCECDGECFLSTGFNRCVFVCTAYMLRVGCFSLHIFLCLCCVVSHFMFSFFPRALTPNHNRHSRQSYSASLVPPPPNRNARCARCAN
jgi:hypothetical protein